MFTDGIRDMRIQVTHENVTMKTRERTTSHKDASLSSIYLFYNIECIGHLFDSYYKKTTFYKIKSFLGAIF